MKATHFLPLMFGLILFIGCKNETKKLEKTEHNPIVPADTRATMEYNQNRIDSIPQGIQEGEIFKGSGGEPFWSVELNDKSIHFKSPSSELKDVLIPIKNTQSNGNTTTFIAERDLKHIEISIIEEECMDGMSGKKNSHRVKVFIKHKKDSKEKEFVGCGYFQNK